MKNSILAALRQAGDGYISGQELSDKLNVSRTAVWKHMKQLQEEGYEIEAVPNRGYHLVASPDILSAEDLASRMHTKWMGKDIRYFSSIGSTNQYAKKIAEEGAREGVLVAADEQTAGKGRSGRHWSTPPGTAIAFTIILRPKLSPERISMVTLVMGMAVNDACRELYHLPVGIKWPNDVVCRGKKICGILTELTTDMESVAYIVIGTGINVNVKEFPEEIRETATSISLELGEDQNRSALLAKVMEYFEKYYELYLQTGDLSLLTDHYNETLLNKEQKVRVLQPGHEYVGTAHGIDKRGELLVEKEDGTIDRVYAGEVSVRGVYGYV